MPWNGYTDSSAHQAATVSSLYYKMLANVLTFVRQAGPRSSLLTTNYTPRQPSFLPALS